MENNSSTLQDIPNMTYQFVLSPELLSLLSWIMDNENAKLKKLIADALRAGLKHEIQHADFKTHNGHTFESAQHTLVEFFGLLEALMVEIMHEQAVENVLERNLMPALAQLDTSACNASTVRSSIDKVTEALALNPHQNPQDVLFKELLKRWKPNKKELPH